MNTVSYSRTAQKPMAFGQLPRKAQASAVKFGFDPVGIAEGVGHFFNSYGHSVYDAEQAGDWARFGILSGLGLGGGAASFFTVRGIKRSIQNAKYNHQQKVESRKFMSELEATHVGSSEYSSLVATGALHNNWRIREQTIPMVADLQIPDSQKVRLLVAMLDEPDVSLYANVREQVDTYLYRNADNPVNSKVFEKLQELYERAPGFTKQDYDDWNLDTGGDIHFETKYRTVKEGQSELFQEIRADLLQLLDQLGDYG